MRKQILTALAAIAFSAAGYTAVMAADSKPQVACEPAPATQSVMLLMAVAVAEPATTTAPAVDVKNTKCLVMPDDDVTEGKTVTYEGKIYHFCCPVCIKKFNKDPEKYIKAFDANPAAFGVQK